MDAHVVAIVQMGGRVKPGEFFDGEVAQGEAAAVDKIEEGADAGFLFRGGGGGTRGVGGVAVDGGQAVFVAIGIDIDPGGGEFAHGGIPEGGSLPVDGAIAGDGDVFAFVGGDEVVGLAGLIALKNGSEGIILRALVRAEGAAEGQVQGDAGAAQAEGGGRPPGADGQGEGAAAAFRRGGLC